MRADPHPLAPTFSAHHPPVQRRERAVIAHELGEDLRQDHRSMAAGLAAQPDHLPPRHGIAQADRQLMANLRRQRQEMTPRRRLMAEVTFSTWTADNLLRHSSFKGLREDKPAREVKFERPSHKGS